MSKDFPEAIIDVNKPWHAVLPAVVASAGLVPIFTLFLYKSLKSRKTGKAIERPLIDELAAQVKEGAKAFLKEEYKFLSVFVAVLTCVLCVLYILNPVYDDEDKDMVDGARVAGAFLLGATLSALAGWGGMMVATDGNSRTTAACVSGTLNDGLRVAFTAGAVMGFTVVGLGLAGVSIVFIVLTVKVDEHPLKGAMQTMQLLSGFGFGASSIALFARVAGGIYTKAADVGADLVGKVEAGIDEDDPHNPAVIADNV